MCYPCAQVGSDHVRVATDVGGGALSELLTEVQHDNTFTGAHDGPHIVFHEQNSGTAIADGFNEGHNAVALIDIHTGHRLFLHQKTRAHPRGHTHTPCGM